MGLIIVGLVIGFAAGIAAAYALLQKRLIEQQKTSEEKTRQIVERLEKDREIQLRQTIESLQKDHQAQLAAKNQEIADLKAAVSASTKTVEVAQPETPTPQEIADPWQEETKVQEATTVQPDVVEETAATVVQSVVEETPAVEPHAVESSTETAEVETAATVVQSVVEETVTQTVKTQEPVNLVIVSTRDAVLLEQIQTWGNSKQTSRIPSLIDSIYHPNAEVRQGIAIALGQICGNQRVSVEIQRVIPALAKLSRDPQTVVRQAAITALGNIRSEKVVPHLRLALRDCNGEVVRIASTALRKLNLSPQTEEIYRRRKQTVNS